MTSISRNPIISVILAVRGVEDYVAASLDSVLGQPFTPVEVIAVGDASGDACGRILDERAARDPRLRVIHLRESVGPGAGRMRGLRHQQRRRRAGPECRCFAARSRDGQVGSFCVRSDRSGSEGFHVT